MAKRKVFGISKDLNEGMSQTINAAKNNAGQLRYEVIPLAKIRLDPNNPRKLAVKPEDIMAEADLSPADPLFERKRRELESIRTLSNSIKRQGVRNAIEVYKDGIDYRLISGERRVLASIMAGKDDIQARVVDNKPSEYDIRYLQWIENIEREDLSIWERIENVRQLVTAFQQHEATAITATSLKEIIGCSLPHAMTYLAILEAPSDIQLLLRDNAITNLEKAAFLAKITDSSQRNKLVKACVEDHLPLSALKKMFSSYTKAPPQITKKEQKKGRVAKRVNLGHTVKITVVKKLMTAAMAIPTLSSHENTIMKIDWTNYGEVSQAFQQLVKLMEHDH